MFYIYLKNGWCWFLYNVWGKDPSSFFWSYGYLCQDHFLKTLFFLHWIAFWFWSWPKINVWVYFWTHDFATLSDMCIFPSLAYSIIAPFNKVLKSRRSFIQICLGPSSISAFQNKIQNKLVSIFKIYVYFAGILIRMEIYISQFGKRFTQHAIF